MTRFARLAAPDVILCPFLKEVVPAAVCERTATWIRTRASGATAARPRCPGRSSTASRCGG